MGDPLYICIIIISKEVCSKVKNFKTPGRGPCDYKKFCHTLILRTKCKLYVLHFHADGAKWSHEAVVLLISLKKENSEMFSMNTISQKQSWRRIAEMMCQKGHHFTGDDCDKKFRSLKLRQGISAVLKIYQDVNFF